MLCLVFTLVHLLCMSPIAASPTGELLDRGQSPGQQLSADPDSSGGEAVAGFPSNTGCYSYLKQKDGCAYRNPTNNCAGKVSSMVVQMFEMSPPSTGSNYQLPLSGRAKDLGSGGNATSNTTGSSSPSPGAISKRNTSKRSSIVTPQDTKISPPMQNSSTSTNSSQSLSNLPSFDQSESDSSICGPYDSQMEMGVCLWSGSDAEGNNTILSGWVSSELTGNCHKEVVLQRMGSTSPAVVARVLEGCSFNTVDPSVGCLQMYVTNKTFMALKPTPREMELGALEDSIIWDFNSQRSIFNAAV